jgi:methylthioribose-1-phosphate isomerase
MTTGHPAVIRWNESAAELVLLDQTRLPAEVVYLHCHRVQDVWDAIARLSVRGAPAIGIAAAYGVCLAVGAANTTLLHQRVLAAIEHLATSRPTAVNLFWALDRMRKVAATTDESTLAARLLQEAYAIHQQDRQLCAAIGRHGAERLGDASALMTHCNAGALATGGEGTALAPIYELHRRGRPLQVFADETRPLLQGARLTAWELKQVGVPVTVITDSMAGSVMKSGKVQAVIVGADRIAANGDVANKIGTYPLAILARHHGIPFFVAAPHSTFDLALSDGGQIPIEHRRAEESTCGFGSLTTPADCDVFNPAFDVTPAELITAIITDLGVIESPSVATVRQVLDRQSGH